MQKYNAIALSGGGSKGIIILGMLHYHFMNDMLSLEAIREFAGTSVGSVISLLLVCGYYPLEIYQTLKSMGNFFAESDAHSAVNLKDIKESSKTGLMSIKGVKGILSKLVKQKLGIEYIPTLKQLYDITKKKLIISATNVTLRTEETFSYLTTPDIECTEAVVISSSIPFAYKAPEYNGYVYTDGGVVNNLPWDYISTGCTSVLALLVGGTNNMFAENSFVGYAYNLIMTPAHRLTEMRKQNAPEYVKIIECIWDSGLLQMNPSDEQKLRMFSMGYHTAERDYESIYIYIDGWIPKRIRKEKNENGWDWGKS